MKFRIKILLPSFLLLFASCLQAKQPNVLYIMSDDHTTQGIGVYGSRLAKLNPTPTIDSIGKEGAILTSVFCTNSICTPSRAAVMTGQYSHVNGVKTLAESIPADRQYLAHWMKAAGYETAMIGKWHLKAEPAAFDYYAVLEGQGWYFNPVFRVRGDQPWPQNEFRFNGYDCVHSSDAITNLSLNWLKKRKAEKPFFLMHHFKAPHDNFENAERYDFLYEDEMMPEPESLWNRQNHGPQDNEQYGTSVGKRNERRNMGDHMFVDDSLSEKDYKRVAYQRYIKKYLRTVKGVDDNVKRLLDYLEETGELDNTIIIYTADQGFMLGEHDYIDKRWMYEESLRMPFLVRYPPLVEAGTVSDAIINNTDFAPTILDLVGGSTQSTGSLVQGKSFASVLQGKSAHHRDSTYYRYWMHMAHHDNPAHFGIRTATHKLIFFYGMGLDSNGVKSEDTAPHWEMYDLAKDPHEMNNIIDDPAYSEVRAKLLKELKQLKQETGDDDSNYPALQKLFESEMQRML